MVGATESLHSWNMTLLLRPPTIADAQGLSSLLIKNRDYFRTGEPLRPDEFYTIDHQTKVITDAQAARDAGTGFMFVIEQDGIVVGRANLNSVIRGAFQSASVGYVVDEAHTGRGIATHALRHMIDVAFHEIGLHRLQAETLIDNHASQRVLHRCGFEHYGTAPEYLRIDGRWQTNALFQLINRDWRE